MAFPDLFKLEKLTIEAFANVERNRKKGRLQVMFNPATLQEKHGNSYEASRRTRVINASAVPATYNGYSAPSSLSFQVVLDGTGVERFGLLEGVSVRSRIAELKELCLAMNPDIHEPNFLKISWGPFKFDCRLSGLDITYKLFDPGGEPLRAELGLAFVKDKSAQSIFAEEGKNSPDLTHVRVVKSGDTLPLLCEEIYGSPAHYLRVAADNGLDDFRNLVPGRKLRFAPLT